jgi:hypothetical protein
MQIAPFQMLQFVTERFDLRRPGQQTVYYDDTLTVRVFRNESFYGGGQHGGKHITI